MQGNENSQEVLQMLSSIEKRLAQAYPTFDELPSYQQKAIFLNALENTSLAELIEIETTNPVCIAAREQRKENERQAAIAHAKLAGARRDDLIERVAAQVEASAKQILQK